MRECKNCQAKFEVTSRDAAFYEQIKVPPPTFCRDCRRTRKISWVNRRTLYRSTCALCKEGMVSMYPPDTPYTVHCRKCWYSDKWDAIDFARDYDFAKPFFEQFGDLLKVVPRIGIVHYGEVVGCTASNTMVGSNNMYMCFSALESEDCAYSHGIDFSKNSLDCLDVKDLELCYENIEGAKNYRCLWTLKTRDSINSAFLYDCQNCQDCFMSSNLRNRQFVFRNKQLDKAGYDAAIREIKTESANVVGELKSEFGQLIVNSLHKYADINRSSNSTGDKIDASSDIVDSFNIFESEHLVYCDRLARSTKDAYDVFGGFSAELIYEGAGGTGLNNVKFYSFAAQARDTEYTDWCHDVSKLFGCVSLRNKSYCILNKQYSKEEYEILRAKIVEQMTKVGDYGEFFPKETSPFAYNESVAQEYNPLNKEEVLALGFRWREPETKDYTPTVQSNALPDPLSDVKDEITKETIACAHVGSCNHSCTTAFRIIQSELSFYRDLKIPLPRLCPNCRHAERLTYRNPFRLWHRACMKPGCNNEFETPYAPERPETVYCESCYQEAVI